MRKHTATITFKYEVGDTGGTLLGLFSKKHLTKAYH
jgi:hypothetical protein